MSQHQVRTEDKNFKTVLATFLANNRVPFMVIAAVVVVLVIGVGIYTYVHQNRVQQSAVAAERLQTLFADWQDAEDEEKDELAEEISAAGEETMADFSGMYAAARARLILGRLAYAQSEYSTAIDHFTELIDSQPKSYLAPVALMHIAVAQEKAGEYEKAIDTYQRVREKYSDTFPEVAHALFSIGRLYETIEDREAALQAYNEVVDDFSSSNWTNLARDRIIYLETIN
ncbi:MAG: tetratricopeptide repeat protein [Spirochaetota bacterium]